MQDSGCFFRRITEQRAVITGEGHRRHDRQVTQFNRCSNRFTDFVKVAEGLDDQYIHTKLHQHFNLFGKRKPGLLRLHPPVRRQAHAQWSDVPGDQHILE